VQGKQKVKYGGNQIEQSHEAVQHRAGYACGLPECAGNLTLNREALQLDSHIIE
jgi:hypothetical protein